MKSLIAAPVIFLLALGGCTKKQTERSVPDFKPGFNFAATTSPSAAQAAAPALVATTAKIGPAGGTLNSSDGKLSISVPAGEFATETEIGIQPSADASGESFGPVYQLSPEGITFPQPVTLAWHLSEDDLATTNLDNLVIGTRTANGGWQAQPAAQRDETAHTISVAANHFSQWGLLMSLRLEPPEATVYVGDSVKFRAFVGETDRSPLPADQVPPASKTSTSGSKRGSATTSQGQSDPDLLAPPKPTDPRSGIFKITQWSVNGIPLGNSTLGLVQSPISGANSLRSGNDWSMESAYQPATYLAPDSVPTPNRVTVSFEVTLRGAESSGELPGNSPSGKERTTKMIATAPVTILPRKDHWGGDSQITQFDGTRVRSDFTFAPVALPGSNNAGSARIRYQILNGIVLYSGPKQTGSGCPLHITPSSHRLTPKEGTLLVDTSNPKQWLISGGGQAVWPATYMTECPNGTRYLQSAVSAGWWPPNPYQPLAATAVDIVPGKAPDVMITVNGPMGQGTVHLKMVQLQSLHDRYNHEFNGAP